ncbi:hypothetical protein ACG3SL_15690 [Sphingomonas sp. CJ20]
MLKFVLIGALAIAATPAIAQDRAHGPQQVSDALKAGCSVQQVHVPAGKIGSAPAIVRCDAQAQLAVADRAARDAKRGGTD